MFFQTRREFLAAGLKGAGLIAAGSFVPSFLARTAQAAAAGHGENILVVVQLSGGNDGLNTIVPFGDDLYYKARPTLGLAKDALLKIDGHSGLHPALRAWKNEFDEGRLAIVQNVGYPNPNRSHFRSMEIWHTGTDAEDRSQVNGWLGRFFDAHCAGTDPKKLPGNIGIGFGKVMPQALRNRSQVGLAIENPDTFQWNTSGETLALSREQEKIFERLNTPGGPAMFQNLAGLGGVTGSEPETLDFLRHTAMNAVLSGDRIRAILGKQKNLSDYPDSQLGNQLKMVARLLAGEFPSRVYYVSQGGFDTHANQPETHSKLLEDLAGSVSAFTDDLRRHHQSERVLVLGFSEFGRRVAENGSRGTDHGAAAPLFLIGEKVRAGLHGEKPDLLDLDDGDLRHKIDFRQVYSSVLEDWLGTSPMKVFPRSFAKTPILRS